MNRRNRAGTYFFVMALALFVIIGGSLSAHALPTGALIVGEIERMGVNNPADPWSAGWIVVGKDNVIIPRNLLIELPANRLTIQQLFVPTPGNPVSGPPAACLANGESGLAKADRCNARVLGAYRDHLRQPDGQRARHRGGRPPRESQRKRYRSRHLHQLHRRLLPGERHPQSRRGGRQYGNDGPFQRPRPPQQPGAGAAHDPAGVRLPAWLPQLQRRPPVHKRPR